MRASCRQLESMKRFGGQKRILLHKLMHCHPLSTEVVLRRSLRSLLAFHVLDCHSNQQMAR